jgi:hypothetical protein
MKGAKMINQVKGKNLTQLEKLLPALTGVEGGFGAAGGNEFVKPKPASKGDMMQAIDWLLSYEWEGDTEIGQMYINVAEFLSGEVLKKFKKDYAKANNCKVSQVKFVEAK